MRPENTKSVEMRFLGSISLLLVSLTLLVNVLIRFQAPSNFPNDPTTKKRRLLEVTELAAAAPKAQQKQLPNNSKGDVGKSTLVSSELEASSGTTTADGRASVLIAQAREMAKQGLATQALKRLEQVLSFAPKHNEALTELGLLYLLDLNSPEKARGYLEQAVKENPSNTLAIAELVDIYAETDRNYGANKLKEFYELHPDSAKLAFGIGHLLVEDNPRAAIEYLKIAAESGDKDIEGFTLPELAHAYDLAGDTSKCIETLLRQARLQKERWENSNDEVYDLRKENYIAAQMALINGYLSHDLSSEAARELENFRQKIGNDKEFQQLTKNIARKTDKDRGAL